MNNINISFGQKKPITLCKVMDRYNQKFVPATFYELDCKDSNDVKELAQAQGNWRFKNAITSNMAYKNDIFNIVSPNRNRFFILQKNDGEVIGMMQTKSQNNDEIVEYLESLPTRRYKYAGQNILASLCTAILNNKGHKIIINNPAQKATPFYIERCGFKQGSNTTLQMGKKGMKSLIENVEQKTQGKIINLEV